jgi:hypothetical protein
MKPFAPAALAAAMLTLAFSACAPSSTSVPVLAAQVRTSTGITLPFKLELRN